MFAAANLPGITLFFDFDRILVVCAKSLRCPACGAAHFWFVNRNGRTCCFGCADMKGETHGLAENAR